MKISIILASLAIALTGCATEKTHCTSGHQVVTHHIETKPTYDTTKVKEIRREDIMTVCKTK